MTVRDMIDELESGNIDSARNILKNIVADKLSEPETDSNDLEESDEEMETVESTDDIETENISSEDE